MAEGLHGLYAGGSGGGDPAGGQGDGEEEEAGGGEGDGVVGAEAVEHGFDEAAEGEGGGEAGGDADDGEPGAFAEDHGADSGALGSEGEADADLVGALGDGVGHDAVDTDAGEREGEDAEADSE